MMMRKGPGGETFRPASAQSGSERQTTEHYQFQPGKDVRVGHPGYGKEFEGAVGLPETPNLVWLMVTDVAAGGLAVRAFGEPGDVRRLVKKPAGGGEWVSQPIAGGFDVARDKKDLSDGRHYFALVRNPSDQDPAGQRAYTRVQVSKASTAPESPGAIGRSQGIGVTVFVDAIYL